MADQSDIRQRLAAVQELKAQYYVPTYNAFYYLKTIRKMDELLDFFCERSTIRFISKEHLTRARLEWLVNVMCAMAEIQLNRIATATSTAEDWSYESDHEVCPVGISPWGKMMEEAPWHYNWELDIEGLFNLFFEFHESDAADKDEEDEKEAVGTIGWDQPVEIIQFLWELLQSAVHIPVPILKAVPSGDTVSLLQFSKETVWRRGPTEFRDIRAMISPNVDYLREIVENEEGARTVERAIELNNPALAHDVLQQQNQEDLANLVEMRFDSFLTSFDRDKGLTEDWLFDDDLYERAEREYTLGYQHIERRIALNVIRRYREDKEFDSIEQLVDAAIAYLRQRMEQCQRDNELPWTPQRRAPEARYQYLAVLQNRKWLIQFLSN